MYFYYFNYSINSSLKYIPILLVITISTYNFHFTFKLILSIGFQSFSYLSKPGKSYLYNPI